MRSQEIDVILIEGMRVRKKAGGDYQFEGVIVARFRKRSGHIRLVVEDDRGLLFIFNDTQLERVDAQVR